MIQVRSSRSDDDAELSRIDALTWTSDVSPSPTEESGRPFFGPGTKVEEILVAEDDSTVLGFVKIHQPMPLPSHTHVLEIGGLAVDPEHQRSGVGRALVEAAAAEARARSARKLSLRVLGPNRPARRLYEACGFVVEGVLVAEFFLNDRYVDDVLMARDLTLSD